jgi:uncharacterized protein YndB with AHSA1/START domain
MNSKEKSIISVQAIIDAPKESVWRCWTNPEDIIRWNNASDDWHTTRAENNLRVGGKFISRMEAKDGSTGFDFEGVYEKVIINERLDYTLGDGRNVKVVFTNEDNKTKVVETFEAENIYSIEMQRTGWQSILDNFKRYTESKY